LDPVLSVNFVSAQPINSASSGFAMQAAVFDEFSLVPSFAIYRSISPVSAVSSGYPQPDTLLKPFAFISLSSSSKSLGLGVSNMAGGSGFGGGSPFGVVSGGRRGRTTVLVRRPVQDGERDVGRRRIRPSPEARSISPPATGTSVGLGRAEPYHSVTRTGRWAPPGITVLAPQFNTLGARQITPLQQQSSALSVGV